MNTEHTQEMDEKTISIISYITIIGWVIAYSQFSKNKSPLATFHIRQSLFLMLCEVVIFIIQMLFVFVPYVGWIISIGFNLIMLGILVLWVIALIGAINGEQKPLPIFGNNAQGLLKGIK